MPSVRGDEEVVDNEWTKAGTSQGPGLRGYYQCRICATATWLPASERRRHTNSAGHLAARADIRPREGQPRAANTNSSFLSRFRSAVTHSSVRLSTPVGPAASTPQLPPQPPPHPPHVPPHAVNMDYDYVDNFDEEQVGASIDDAVINQMKAIFQRVVAGDIVLEDTDNESNEPEPSDNDDDEGPGDDSSNIESAGAGPRAGVPRPRNYTADEAEQQAYFPWGSKLSTTLDLLAHLPRSTFSDAQFDLILHTLEQNGVDHVPSVDVMKGEHRRLQQFAGVETRKYKGAANHTYYVNDIGQIIAQEMANPRVRPHLRFYPEDAGASLNEAWHGARWGRKMDPSLLTPMIRVEARGSFQDFYTFEPTLLSNNRTCMPNRWIQVPTDDPKVPRFRCLAWSMELSEDRSAWIIREDIQMVVQQEELVFALPLFAPAAASRGWPSPHNIRATVKTNGRSEEVTRQNFANPWRQKAGGRRVFSFLTWMYCDDTSGNVSKKWNKHNSFLFTPAGLPRAHVHREYNVHFLCTSNRAPPTEMLEGIADQFETYQDTGISAYDAVLHEDVLVIPAVLALLGDNPMQSELACHIGLTARLFCRVCWVSSAGKDVGMENEDSASDEGADIPPDPGDLMDVDERDARSEHRAPSAAPSSRASVAGSTGPRRRVAETLDGMISRVKRFIKKGKPRERNESIGLLRNIFSVGLEVGGATKAKQLKTESGLKDRYADNVMESILRLICDLSDEEAGHVVEEELRKYRAHIGVLSPIWRIKGLDPHSDTPVEILHVVLLGFLKYFWRDAIARLTEENKARLVARLSSFNVRGLGIPPIAGQTLVQYCGSLTGRDFRVIAQAAPFVLHDLGLPESCLQAWLSLSALVPMLWQPEIEDSEDYLARLDKAIRHFLLCTARWTPRWFNKPKFHILLHIVDHIRDLGPAVLFATEGFESFNALIRAMSVHSNRQAPSRDIARAFAQMNRVRHLTSGGYFAVPESDAMGVTTTEHRSLRPARQAPASSLEDQPRTPPMERVVWRQYGPGAKSIAEHSRISRHVGFYTTEPLFRPGACTLEPKDAQPWTRTKVGKTRDPPPDLAPEGTVFKTAKDVILPNGDKCAPGDWVLIRDDGVGSTGQHVARLEEILQAQQSQEAAHGLASFLVVRTAEITGLTEPLFMPKLRLRDQYSVVQVQDINCSANVQHNCVDCKCRINARTEIMEERERSGRTKPAVKHKEPANADISPWILNMAKMRDAKHIQRFRLLSEPLHLDEDEVVRYGAEQEIVARQGRITGSSGAAAASKPVPRRVQQLMRNHIASS